MTYVQLQIDGLQSLESIPPKLPSYPQDSLVSLTALREKVGAIVTSVTCGEKLSGCSERLDRRGSSVKIRPVYLQEKISGISGESFPTLPRWGITLHGEYGELTRSERRTSATEYSLSHTETHGGGCSFREIFPTPTVADSKNVGFNGSHQFNLHKYVALFPTPQATSWGCSGARAKLRELQDAGVISEEERKGMQAGNGGKLNPTWVEWLMGFPLGWTSLEDLETQ